MEDMFLDFIKEHFGIAFLLAIVVLVGFIYFIWWTCKIYLILQKIDRLPCDRYNDKYAKKY